MGSGEDAIFAPLQADGAYNNENENHSKRHGNSLCNIDRNIMLRQAFKSGV